MKDKKLLIICIFVIFLFIFFLSYNYLKKEDNKKNVDDITVNLDIDNGDEKIDWSIYSEKELLSNNITEDGIYRITESSPITINTSSNVKLILDNVNIKSENGPCINILNAKNVVIFLEGNNVLSDSSNYQEDINATIYSKSDLIFEGDGTLKVNANYEDAIVSKDDLKIISGTYIINAVDDGIRVKDSLYIVNADININSGGDGIKTTNEENIEKGFIKIDNGKITIKSALDAIQASTNVVIDSGIFDIKTKEGSSISSSFNNFSNETNSAKGIKANNSIIINNGTFDFNTQDDSIHSNNYVDIKDGCFNIESGDDAIHADNKIIIENGTINISKSYEGIEASEVIINDGNISVNSTDDGLNAGGGNDSSSLNRPGSNNFKGSTNSLTINGGNIYVNSSGDGLDANGSIYITGGKITVDGPIDNGNGPLDYDNVLNISGGELFAIGSSGMAQGISDTSSQYGILINFDSSYKSGSIVKILDSDNNEIFSYKSNKAFSSIVYSSDKLENKETYTIKVDGNTINTVTISSISTTFGSKMNDM